ncbi:hypothetical protein Ahy_A05g025575 [Arachis hypogaea]|uniref:Histidine kinase/HSP90-like ATPase domain-containing protein n=1 Tax=Arachis hypogaea TaxID=3818 RepID=A0A445D915_ARAHY|nr:hypothetical protein Ahy_A05g025575 [Arachis hypogaea]
MIILIIGFYVFVQICRISPKFFAENKNIAGFDNPGKSLYTTVRELVENSLDSAEEIKKSKFNSMIGLIDCGQVVAELYDDYETEKVHEVCLITLLLS